MSNSLKIPSELTALIESGFWPQNQDEAERQNLKPLFTEPAIQLFASEGPRIFLYWPSLFITVREAMNIDCEKPFWSEFGATGEIDPDLVLLIGDFGPGSDAPFALDYRLSATEPRVIRLKWDGRGRDNHWVEMYPNFREFARHLEQ